MPDHYLELDSGACSRVSDLYGRLTGRALSFERRCLLHDAEYAVGGSRRDRRRADLEFRRGVFFDVRLALRGRGGFWSAFASPLARVVAGLLFWRARLRGGPRSRRPRRWGFLTSYPWPDGRRYGRREGTVRVRVLNCNEFSPAYGSVAIYEIEPH